MRQPAPLGQQIVILEPRGDREYEMAFKTLVEREAGALVVGPFLLRNIEKIVTLAASYKIPTIYPRRDYVEAGGLMSYARELRQTPIARPESMPAEFSEAQSPRSCR